MRSWWVSALFNADIHTALSQADVDEIERILLKGLGRTGDSKSQDVGLALEGEQVQEQEQEQVQRTLLKDFNVCNR